MTANVETFQSAKGDEAATTAAALAGKYMNFQLAEEVYGLEFTIDGAQIEPPPLGAAA
jgi:hypothetical protein